MNLKILFMILVYYSIISLTFVLDTGHILTNAGYSENINITKPTGLDPSETGTGGIFSIGVSVARFFGFVLFGIGLPGSTPGWFMAIFAMWETILSLFTVGFIINSIWSGGGG